MLLVHASINGMYKTVVHTFNIKIGEMNKRKG